MAQRTRGPAEPRAADAAEPRARKPRPRTATTSPRKAASKRSGSLPSELFAPQPAEFGDQGEFGVDLGADGGGDGAGWRVAARQAGIHQAAQVAMIEKEIEVEIVLADGHALLASNKAEPAPQFKKHAFHFSQDRSFHVAFAVAFR